MRAIKFLPYFAFLLCLPQAYAQAERPHNSEPFGLWRHELQQEARQRGFRRELVEELGQLQPLPRVIELDRRQPETTLTLPEYLQRVLPPARIEKARRLYRENKALLTRIGAEYGVQPRFIVALWGIESNFGDNMGDFEIVESLATLAYDGRRSVYFRKELFNALTILQQGHISYGEMTGSWAGAMGQCQFMPTSFLRYAVDADGDGRKDIWNTQGDIFASIANYLSAEGWDGERGWGTQARPAHNFNVLLKWNRSRYFATAVGMLADSIGRQG